MNPDIVARARALVGVRFRPQGRVPILGLDCVGLIVCAFQLPANSVRTDYRLRGEHRRELLDELTRFFRRIPARRQRAGDVLLLQVSQDQAHLAIATTNGFVHADARRGKVVETPGTPPWPMVAAFRRRRRNAGKT